MTRPRKITRRLKAFPWLMGRAKLKNGWTNWWPVIPLIKLKNLAPPPGYAAWKRRYKAKRRKAA